MPSNQGLNMRSMMYQGEDEMYGEEYDGDEEKNDGLNALVRSA